METAPSPMAEVVTREVLCVRCGYNLRTLRVDGTCTECGLAVQTTLDTEQARTPVSRGARWLAIGAMVLVITHGAALVANVYQELASHWVTRFNYSAWYTPLPPLHLVLTIVGCAATGTVAWSGLGPDLLKWGRVHAPLYWVCGGISALMASPYEAFYFLMNIFPGRIGAGAVNAYRVCHVLLLTALLLQFLTLTYGYLYMQGVGARPQFMRLRTFTTVLFIGALTSHLIAVGFQTLNVAMVLRSPMRPMPPTMVTLYHTFAYVRHALTIATIGYWVLVMQLARRVQREICR